LRWQKPSEPHGFIGIKEPILVRTKKDPKYQPDWSSWSQQDRNEIYESKSKKALDSDDKFSPVITGPWMARWKMLHHNQHTKKFIETGGDPSLFQKS
jgi:hypothetical protein